MANSVRFWAIDDELTMTDPASDPDRYTRLQGQHAGLDVWQPGRRGVPQPLHRRRVVSGRGRQVADPRHPS
jgi:hypothetical protein